MDISMRCEKDYSISLIRFLSMISIISCHIMQKLDIELSNWLNVGVQVFLCISGYLYSKKDKTDDISFYKKSFAKILIDYYIMIVPVMILYFLFADEYILPVNLIKVLILKNSLPGGGHLWFVATILMCYILTPIYMRVFEKAEQGGVIKYIFIVLFLLFVNIIAFDGYSDFNSSHINCYVIGFLLGRNEIKRIIPRNLVTAIVFTVTFIANSIIIYINYILHIEFDGIVKSCYNMFWNYGHVFLGVALFIALKYIFDEIHLYKIKNILDFSDRYSYDVYLVHQFVILGPFSLMQLTSYLLINIIIIILIICISAFFLNNISDMVKMNVTKILSKI